MAIQFLRVVSQEPFVFEIERDGQRVSLVAHWFEDFSDSKERIETAISRYNEARSFSQWLAWWDLHLVTVEKTDSDKNDLILAQDLCKMLKIARSTLSRRIEKMGFPPPVLIDGRKQWFDSRQVDQWQQQQKR